MQLNKDPISYCNTARTNSLRVTYEGTLTNTIPWLLAVIKLANKILAVKRLCTKKFASTARIRSMLSKYETRQKKWQ